MPAYKMDAEVKAAAVDGTVYLQLRIPSGTFLLPLSAREARWLADELKGQADEAEKQSKAGQN